MHKFNARIRQQFRQLLPTAMIGILSFALSTGAFANPVLDNVAHGNVSIQQTNTTTTVNQTSQKGIVNWQSFNINQGEHTHFNQPNGGVTLNRISPNQGASQIFGKLSATGKIILVNPAGVYIGPGAFINVGGLVASTAGISNENFLNGYYNFNQLSPYAGAIVNKGTIIAADHGLVALMGHAVSNEGVIQASMGKIALASGEAFIMSFAGNDMISFVVDKEVMQRGVDANGNSLSDGVTNTGILRANGGQILLHAKSAAGVLDNVINLEGIVEAKTVQDVYGEIVLTTDNNVESVIRVAGNLDATGFSAGERGGNITVTGYNILVDSPALLNASGDTGGGNIRIGGNYLGQGPIANAKAVVLAPGAVIKANAVNHGDGGEVIFWSDNYTNIQGDRIEARGGSQSGDGGFIETSSKDTLAVGEIVIDTSAENGETGVWLLDPRNVTVTGSTSGGSFDGGSPTNTFTPTADNATVSNTSIQTNLASANVTVTTGATGAQNGDITVSSGITWTSTNTLTLDAAGDIVINAGISGVNGSLALSAGSSTNTITTGASGTIAVANFDLQRGIWTQIGTLPSFSVTNNFQINSGTVPNANARFIRALSGDGSSAGANAYAITDIYGLQGMASDTTTLADHFKLANDIDASGTTTWNGGSGFAPIGNTASPFTASVDGQNFEILSLYINRGTTRVGLFGETQTGSSISNIGLANATIIVNTFGNSFSGSLVGYSRSTVDNAYTRNLTFTSTANVLGGLLGRSSATVNNAWSTGTISGGFLIGGLIGTNHGDTNFSWSSVDVTGSSSVLGGLSGDLNAGRTISDSYATGSVTSTGNSSQVGGLVGEINDETVQRSYSTGLVTTAGTAGGLIGSAQTGGSVLDSFWDTETSGRSNARGAGSGTLDATGGCFGATSCTGGGTVDLTQLATYTAVGWSSTAGVTGSINSTSVAGTTSPNYTWFVFPGETRPILLSELYPTTSTVRTIRNSHQLQLAASTRGHNYTLGNDIDLASGMTNTSSIWGTNSGTSTGSGFLPIGDNTLNYTGTFNGGNYDVTNIYIDRTTTDYTGLFGRTSAAATIQNVGVTGTISGQTYVGGIAGYNAGTISNTHANVNITLNPGFQRIGGITGENASGATITNSYTEGSITGTNPAGGFSRIGGIAGSHSGTMTNVFSDMAIMTTNTSNTSNLGGIVGEALAGLSNFYFTGSVTVNGPATDTGGLIGILNGAITAEDFYNIGSFTVTGAGNYVGGLIGVIRSNAIAQNGFQAGYVSTPGGSKTVGLSCCGTNALNNVFYDTLTTGGGTTTIIADFGGNALTATGDTRTNLMAQATYPQGAGQWDFTTTWGIVEGRSYPYLRAFYSSAPRIIAGFVNGGSANTQVDLVSNGNATPVATNNTANAGYFYFQLGTNALSGTTNVAANDYLLLYVNDGGTTLANHVTVAPSFNGSLSGTSNIVLTPNTLTIGGDGIATLSHANMSTALGSYGTSDPNDIIFSIDGSNNLTVESGSNYTSYSNVTYQPEGNITLSGGGDISFFSSVQLNNDIAISSDILSISGNITGSTSTRNLTLTNTDVSGFGITGTITTNIGNIIKNGTGTLALSGNNTYTGTTTINAGTLTVSNANALGGTGSGTIIASGTTLDISNAAIGTEAITLQGGTITSQGTASLAGSVNMTADSFINTGFGSTLTLNGVISGSQAVTFNGFGTVEYGGANTYTGDTNINFSLLRILANNRIPDSSSLIFADLGLAGLDMNNFNDAVSSISGGGAIAGNISLGTGTLTINQSSDATYSAIISGAGNIIKQGANSLTLAGTNTYTGTTTINAGTLSIAADSGLGADPGTPTAGHLVFNGGTLQTTATMTLDSDRGIALTGNGTLDVSTGTLTYNGIIAGSGTLSKSSSGSLVLGGVNTYTGSTSLNAGTISIAADSGLGADPGSATPGHLTFNGGTLATTASFTVDSDRGIALTGTGTFDVTTGTLTYGGIMAGSGALTQSGSGTLLLQGNNTITGAVNIDAGVVDIEHANALGSSNTNAVTIASGAQLTTDFTGTMGNTGQINLSGRIRNNSGDAVLSNNIVLSNAAADFYTADDLRLNGIISGSGMTLTKANSGGRFRLGNANNTHDGGTVSTSGRFYIEDDGSLGSTSGSITLNTSSLLGLTDGSDITLHANRNVILSGGQIELGGALNDGILRIAGVVSGSPSSLLVRHEGSSQQTLELLNASNTFTAPISIGRGDRLQISSDGNLGNTSNDITFGNGGPGALLTTATMELNSSRELKIGSPYYIEILPASGTTLTFDGVISGSSGTAYDVQMNGEGTLALGGTNTFTGGVQVDTGTLLLNSISALGTSSGHNILVQNGGDLQFDFSSATLGTSNDININDSSSRLTFTGTAVDIDNSITVTGSTLGGTGTATLDGVIDGTSLIKDGSGTVTFGGVNTYTGSTTINGGTLSVAAESGLGAVPGVATPSNIVINGGTLELTSAFDLDANRGIYIGASGATFDASNTNVNGIVDGPGTITAVAGFFRLINTVNTYTGGTVIDGASFSFAADGSLGAVPGTVDADNVIVNSGSFAAFAPLTTDTNRGILLNAATVAFSGQMTIDGPISGIGRISRHSTGSLNLTNASNTFSGGIYSSVGTVSFTSDGAMGADPGTPDANYLELANNGSFLFNNSFTVDSDRGLTMTSAGRLDTSSNNIVYDGVITGSGSLAKIASGTLSLGGANTNTGGVTISNGTLTATSAGALGASGAITVDPGNSQTAILDISALTSLTNTSAITLESNATGDTAQLNTSNTINLSNAITLTDTSNTISVGANTTTLSGTISGSGGFTKSGSGTLSITQANSYTGGTTISGGTLTMGDSSALGTSGNVTFNGASTTLGFTANVSLSRPIVFTTAGTIDIGGQQVFISGDTSGTGTLTVVNSGAGTSSSELLFFSSGSNTTRVASTIINSGSQVILNSADNLGTTDITVHSGASLRLSNSTNLNIPLTINGTGYAPLGTTGALYVAQTSTSNQVSSLITLGSAATIYVATTGGNPATTMNQIDFNGNNLTINNGTTLNLADQLYGAGNLTKQGGGTLSLQASNLYSGTTSIEAGIVSVEAINAMNAGAVNLNSGATLSLSNTIANALTLRGTGTSGQGALVASGTGTANGNITLASSVSVGIGAPTGGDTLTVGGSISGAEQLVYSGSGTINQNGNISGVTNVTVGAGFTQFNVGASSIASSLVQTYSSPIRLTNDLSISGNTLTLNAVTTDGTARSFTANSGSGSLTLNGALGASGAGNSLSALSLTAGSGNLTLGANNVFSNGNVSLTATAGLVSQTTGSISGGTFTVSAANGISLTSNNSVTSLDATVTGAGNLSYTDTGALSIAGIGVSTNAATITTGGALTQTGTITAGDASFSVGANAITLTNTNAITGTATFNNSGANNVALTNASANLDIGTSNVGSGTFSVTNTGEMTTSGVITSSGGDITLTTLTSDNSERDLTVGANILSTGGNISLNAANNDTDTATPLIINGDIDTSPGTGGTVITSGGTNITGTIIPGGGNITLNGGGLDLTLGTFTVTNDITLTAIRNIILNGDITALNGNIIFDRPVILGANITLTASDTGTQTFTYNSGLSGSNTFNIDATGTGTYQLIVNGAINTSGISFNGGTNASNSSITLASGGSQVYSINAPNAGSISGDNIQGNVTFINTPNLTGGANGNAFNFTDTGSISGTVDGTTTTVSSTVSFENYSSGIIVAFDSQYAGNITNSSSSSLLVNFDNIDDIVSNLNNIDSSSVRLAPKASTLNITGATSGFIDDPTYVTNFNSYEATAGDSTVNFTTSAVLDRDTGTATVDGSTITFVNFDNYTGNFTSKETVTNVLESAEVEAEAEVKTIESDPSENTESIADDQKAIAEKIIDETLVGQGKACATVRNASGQAATRGGAGGPTR